MYSFGVIAWELVTLKTPYEGIHQLKMANGIARGSLRLEFPETAPSQIINLSNICWNMQAAERPSFSDLIIRIERMRLEMLGPQALAQQLPSAEQKPPSSDE